MADVCLCGDGGPDPKCPDCKGVGWTGDFTKCSDSLPLCMGRIHNWCTCTCVGGLPDRYGEWKRHNKKLNLQRLYKDAVERVAMLEDVLFSVLQESAPLPGLKLALSIMDAVEEQTERPSHRDREHTRKLLYSYQRQLRTLRDRIEAALRVADRASMGDPSLMTTEDDPAAPTIQRGCTPWSATAWDDLELFGD